MQSEATRAVSAPADRRQAGTGARIYAFWSRRPTLAAAVIYAVLATIMVGQGLLPGRTLSGSDSLLSSTPWAATKPASVPGLGTNFELADSADVFQPMLQYTRSVLPQVPLWNPYLMAGRPLLADGQSAVFSVFSIPSYVLPFWKSLAAAAILKLFLGALGVYVLARLLGMGFGGALLSGVVFAFGTFFVVWLAWPLSSVYAFIGWTLALTELVLRRPGRLPVAGLAAVVCLQFLSGHPESSFHLLFVAVVFFVFRALLRYGRSLSALWRPALAFLVALAAGGGLAALMLVPFGEFLLNSADLARRSSTAAGYWPRKYLGALFLHDYWGRPTQVDLEAFMQVRGWYAGAATLMLAATALIVRRSAQRIALVVFALFCVCMVVGIPPVFGIVSSLPGFSAAHNERLLIYFLLCLALLAGYGLDDLARAAAVPGRRLVLAACIGLFLIPFAWLLLAGTLSLSELGEGLKVAWGFVHPPVPPPGVDAENTVTGAIVRDSSLLMWTALAGAGLALIAARLGYLGSRRLRADVFVGLIVLLVAADLFRANMGFNPAIRTSTAEPPTTGAIRYLQSQRPNRFIGVSTAQLSQPLTDDLAMHFGLYDARGYDFPVETRFDALWRQYVAPGVGDFTQPEEFAEATPVSLRALDLLSVSDLLVDPLLAKLKPLHEPGLRVVYDGKDGVIYGNDQALPRVFVVNRQHTVAGGDVALHAVMAPGFDRRAVAVTESPIAGLPQATSGPPAAASARLVSYKAERVEIHATASARSLVILTDNYYPGWQVTVDGHPAKIERVDYLLRGVVIGPGSHTIVYTYRPTSWTVGWIISLVTALALLAAVASALLARRRRVRVAT